MFCFFKQRTEVSGRFVSDFFSLLFYPVFVIVLIKV